MAHNITQTDYGANLDITHYDLSKDMLMLQILEDVKASQSFPGNNLPDKLIMSDDQFKLLSSETQQMEGTKDRMYLTPFNVMEVKVVQ